MKWSLVDWGLLMMNNDIDDLLDAAFRDYNRGNLESAEQKARDVLIISPSHGDCFYLLGLIAYKKGIFAQACDLLNVAVKAYPEQNNYRLALAEVYQHHGDYDKALELYHPLKNIPNVQLQIGWIALYQKKKTKAKKIFKNLILTPLIARAYHGLAFCCQKKDRLKYLKKSLKIEQNPLVAEDLVRYYLAENLPKKILPYLDMIQNDLLKAQYFFALKKYSDSMLILNEYIKKNQYDLDALVLIGVCAEIQKDYQTAEKFYRQVLSLDKNNWDAHKGMAHVMMQQKKLPLALDHYQVLCRLNPQDKETLLAMATTLEGIGDETEALGIYFRLLTLRCSGLNLKIKSCIQQLYQKDQKLAKQFAHGWMKNYPKNQIAQKLFKTLGIFLIVFWIIMPVNADYFSDEQNWDWAWRNRMAKMGHAESQYELAEMFEEGRGVPKNLSQAVHYYQLAAQKDYFPAMLKLGDIFERNNVYTDREKSLQWYTYAAQKGEVQAQLHLANYYQESEHYDKNQAKFWLEKALYQLFPNATDLSEVSPDYKRLSE